MTAQTQTAAPPFELLERLKTFLSFDDADAENLRSMAAIVGRHGPAITDAFYVRLAANPKTAPLIEGRVDALKGTHRAWMASLTSGDYGPDYLTSRWRIGLAHVRVGLEPWWVESVMSFIRTSMLEALAKELADPAELARKHNSFVKVCDLDLLIINLSYGEDRLARITEFTGMKRALLENIIRLPKK